MIRASGGGAQLRAHADRHRPALEGNLDSSNNRNNNQ
jgi:hypothetical protein